MGIPKHYQMEIPRVIVEVEGALGLGSRSRCLWDTR